MEREAVERVARRLALADGFHPDAASNDDASQEAWTLYVGQAHAAIAEVMAILGEPPTRAMYAAAFDELVPAFDAQAAWRSMLSASPLSQGGQDDG